MITLCCAVNRSPTNDTDKSHLNPIYHKLGGKKNKAKGQKSEITNAETCPTKQSIIYECALSKVSEASRHVRTNSEFVQSSLLSYAYLK
jgi:hypothetical protein